MRRSGISAGVFDPLVSNRDDGLVLVTCACTVCGSLNNHHFCDAKTHWPCFYQKFEVKKCLACGALYMNPRLSGVALTKAYSYIQGGGSQGAVKQMNPLGGTGFIAWLKRYWQKKIHANVALKYIKEGPVLDVGCGQGDLLSELASRGIQCAGIEFSKSAVEIARAKGLNVELGDVEHILDYKETLGEGFRYIVLSHVLEHLPDPVNSLKVISELLAANGQLIVVVPNANSGMRFIFGQFWHGWDPPFHLTHFQSNSLRQVAVSAGLIPISIRTGGEADDLNRSLDLLFSERRRRLILRLLFTPIFPMLSIVGFGPHIEAVFSKPVL